MPSYTPNIAEEEILRRIWTGEDHFIGLISNTIAALDALGESMVFADLTQVTNVTPASSAANGAAAGVEWRMDPLDVVVPTGAQSGNDATHPQIEFTANAGGASADVSGYYIRDGGNNLLAVVTDPNVVNTGVRRVMNEGARFRLTPALGAE